MNTETKPRPRMRGAKGPGLANVYHVNAPKGFVVDEVLYGIGGTVVTIRFRPEVPKCVQCERQPVAECPHCGHTDREVRQ